MSQIDILTNAGQEILDGVTAAVNSGDFSRLSSDINNAVTQAANGIISQAKHIYDGPGGGARDIRDRYRGSPKYHSAEDHGKA